MLPNFGGGAHRVFSFSFFKITNRRQKFTPKSVEPSRKSREECDDLLPALAPPPPRGVRAQSNEHPRSHLYLASSFLTSADKSVPNPLQMGSDV